MAKRYSKTRIVSTVLMALLGIVMSLGIANAAATVPTIDKIAVTVSNAANKAYATDLSDKFVVATPSGATLTKDAADGYTLTKDVTKGQYTFTLPAIGEYSVSLSDDLGTTQTVKTTVGLTSKSKPATMKWLTQGDTVAPSKIGAIGGVIYNSTGTAVANAKVKITSSVATAATWTTTSTTNGAFQVLLPTGTNYKLIVYGNGPTTNPVTNYLNTLYNLTVTAGQMTSPFVTMTNDTGWATGKETLGLTLTTPSDINSINGTTKIISGTVNNNATVYVYDITTSSAIKLVATAKTTTKSGGVGTFSATLPSVITGMKLGLTAIDTAENQYSLSMDSVISTLDPKLSASTTPIDYGKDVTITFTDANKLMTPATTKVLVTTGSAITTTGSGITLTGTDGTRILPTTLYTLTAGSKIVIKAAAFDVGTYQIKLSNSAFDDTKSTATRVIQASTATAAPSLTVTAKVGTALAGDTILTVTPTAGNSISYRASDVTIATPKIGAATTGSGLSALSETKTVSGLNMVDKKFLGVYELTASGSVAKFKLLTLTAAMIKADGSPAPASPIATIDSTNKIITLTFANNIYKATAANITTKSAIKLATNGTSFGALKADDTAVISGKTVTITLGTALTTTTNKIQIAAKALQTLYGVTNTAAITSDFIDGTALAPELTGFTWAPGTGTGTTQATTVPTGTLKYVVGAAGAQTQPKLAATATAYATALTATTDITVTTGQHIFIVEVDGDSKVLKWADVAVLDANIK